MSRTTIRTAAATVALMAVPLAGAAHADGPGEPPARDPLPTTFSLGEGADTPDLHWTLTVGGEFTDLPFSQDGLVSLTVEGSTANDLINADENTNRQIIGAQQDDSTDFSTQQCPDTAELAPSPVTFSSTDRSWLWENDAVVAYPTQKIDTDMRSLTIQSVVCQPNTVESDFGPFLFSTDHYVFDADKDNFVRVASETMEASGREGSQSHWFAADGWEFIEEYVQQQRPEGLSDEEWADQMVAEGIVPADKRWYVANTEPGAGPIVDTGRTVPASSDIAPWAAGLAGLGLLGAGAGTVAVTRRRA
ncbi:hypothetical protein [Kytococcus sedentarius]|uniref:hypothetical protein n=1 Tax=Kytococcus sedentarius TaxID=1276 RepID=UPI0035BC3125